MSTKDASAEPPIQLLDFVSRAAPPGLLSQADIHAWSIREPDEFWRNLLSWSNIRYDGSAATVCDGSAIETARFFPDLTLNYADNLLSSAFSDSATALVSIVQGSAVRTWSRAELREAVEQVAGSLRSLGISPGDRVGAITRNTDKAVILALATSALGGVYAATAIDFGPSALQERLSRIAPKALIVDAAADQGRSVPVILDDLLPVLPSLRMVITLHAETSIVLEPVPTYSFEALMSGVTLTQSEWPKLPFNHPLFILFTSGTTGPPKCIVHAAAARSSSTSRNTACIAICDRTTSSFSRRAAPG